MSENITHDYHKEEIDFWKSKISFEEVEQFCKENRVEIIMGADWQYQCYINSQKKMDGCDDVALTFIGALFGGIYKYKHRNDE